MLNEESIDEDQTPAERQQQMSCGDVLEIAGEPITVESTSQSKPAEHPQQIHSAKKRRSTKHTEQVQPVTTPNDGANDRTKASDKCRNESDKGFKEIGNKDRRDDYRKRRSRSPSNPRLDR